MYNKIKNLQENTSVRKTAELLSVSPGTVQKYFQMDLKEASARLSSPTRNRKSQFEVAISFIEEILSAHPQIPAVVLLRKVKERYPLIYGKVRAFRDFLKPYREKFKDAKPRYFHPVKTCKEDSQVQVDMGEIRTEYSGFVFNIKIYFIVFVFSYSRKMYVSYQERPYKTEDFIKAHLEAFRYFGGVAKEYVYDQTKLVVINEKYREVLYNEKFHKFALTNQFKPIVCEGYDPQSKGKVERAIGYVKSSFLGCEYFDDIEDLRKNGLEWLNEIANCRIHSTTGRSPDEMFEEEKPFLNRELYLQNSFVQVRADKTNLISYKSNKYSVPYVYQGKKVAISADNCKLYCHDIVTGKQIAVHDINHDNYQIITDASHYISPEEKMAKVEQKVKEAFADNLIDTSFVANLIDRIKRDNHNYARHQLLGLAKLSHKYPPGCWQEIEKTIFELPKVKISVLTRLLDISFNDIDVFLEFDDDCHPISSSLDRPLEVYMKKIKRGGINA
ncbi:MAG: IS21 family transposase [Candidatus Cloacimonetes bacterium]|nr:IS21 family transposase [Candidatus Cloacimonadota bacterium]